MKWAIDFVVKFTNVPKIEKIMEFIELPAWRFFIDGLLGEAGSRARVVFVSPKGHIFNCTMTFRFKASSKVTEYQAFLSGL